MTIDGIAKITISAVTSIDQTNSGIRLSDMPGARALKMVATSSTDTASAATSVKVMSCAQKSARLPGV